MSSIRKEILTIASETLLSNKDIAKIVGCSIRTVNRYAGSHTERCRQKMSTTSEDMFKIKKSVLLPDIHHPNYEQRVMDAVDEFIIDYEPDELVYMGDQIDLSCVSSWSKNKPLLKEGKRLLKDYNDFNQDILINHENITSPETERVFIFGNHEQRVSWYIEQHPELDGFINIEKCLNLEERGYKIVPFNEIHYIGKLAVIHGFFYNKYHATKTLDAFEGNVVYGHVHNPQMYAKVTPLDQKGYHTATSLPCLSTINPNYRKNMPNRFLNGFGIVEHLPATGQFHLYTIIIVDGSFMWNGRYYGKEL
jgi:predicted phosphodiesterase